MIVIKILFLVLLGIIFGYVFCLCRVYGILKKLHNHCLSDDSKSLIKSIVEELFGDIVTFKDKEEWWQSRI